MTIIASGLPPAAPVLYKFGWFQVNNSMIVAWIVALILILLARAATSNIQKVPTGAQNFWEWLVESLYGFLEKIIGSDLIKHTFWFFGTIFIFILSMNWFALIPGVGTVGWGHAGEHGFHVSTPFIRGANADLNMTLAMSLTFFFWWIVWALKANGPVGFIKHIFGSKGGLKGFMGFAIALIFICVGLIEVVSILFRPVSLSFRLYGNIFAGENLLEAMGHIFFLLPLPFYLLELLVGLVQALVYCLLTAVFTLLICTHDESHDHDHGHGEEKAGHH